MKWSGSVRGRWCSGSLARAALSVSERACMSRGRRHSTGLVRCHAELTSSDRPWVLRTAPDACRPQLAPLLARVPPLSPPPFSLSVFLTLCGRGARGCPAGGVFR